jgi:sodium/potassium-transporting ATPase subunit alpha
MRYDVPIYEYTGTDGNTVFTLIPFSSEIKFNLFVRDLKESESKPRIAKENLCIFMKGAPERILNRCSKILVNGEERDFDDEAKKEVNEANK